MGARLSQSQAKQLLKQQAERIKLAKSREKERIEGNLARLAPRQPAASRYDFIIDGPPVPQPGQTQADKWYKRPRVERYRAWVNRARLASTGAVYDGRSVRIALRFFMPFPRSWEIARTANMKGLPHLVTPDVDNLCKAVLDALWPDSDSHVWSCEVEKRWDDGGGPRTEVRIYYE